MKEQIKALRNHLKLSQADFGAKLNSTRATVQAWEYGLNKPSAAMQALICQCYGVNRTWLETGEGEMMAETQSRTLDRIAARYGKSDILRSVLDVYANLTDDEQDAVDRYIRLCASAIANDQVPNAAAAETSESLEAGAINSAAQLDQAAQ